VQKKTWCGPTLLQSLALALLPAAVLGAFWCYEAIRASTPLQEKVLADFSHTMLQGSWAFPLLILWFAWLGRVVATPEALVMLNGKIPWCDIAEIGVRPTGLGYRQAFVILRTGKRRWLPAPYGFLDRHFDERVAALQRQHIAALANPW